MNFPFFCIFLHTNTGDLFPRPAPFGLMSALGLVERLLAWPLVGGIFSCERSFSSLLILHDGIREPLGEGFFASYSVARIFAVWFCLFWWFEFGKVGTMRQEYSPEEGTRFRDKPLLLLEASWTIDRGRFCLRLEERQTESPRNKIREGASLEEQARSASCPSLADTLASAFKPCRTRKLRQNHTTENS